MSRNLAFETNVLWLESCAKFPYLRESLTPCTARKGWKKAWAHGRHVVAIAELSDDARTIQRRVQRRMWYFDDALDPYRGHSNPSEGVVPESIAAGKESTYGRRPASTLPS